MLITQKGILIRTRVSEIRETGRSAQGVRLIKIDEGDRLVAMTKIDVEEAPKGIDGAAPAEGVDNATASAGLLPADGAAGPVATGDEAPDTTPQEDNPAEEGPPTL